MRCSRAGSAQGGGRLFAPSLSFSSKLAARQGLDEQGGVPQRPMASEPPCLLGGSIG